MSTESAMHRNDANNSTMPVTIAEFTTILPNNRSGSGYENSTSSSANDFGLSNWRYWFIVLSICTSVTVVAFCVFAWITFRSKFKKEKTCNHNWWDRLIRQYVCLNNWVLLYLAPST